MLIERGYTPGPLQGVTHCIQLRASGVTPTPTDHKLRELIQTTAQVEGKLLHFFFLFAADFFIGPEADYALRNAIGIAKAEVFPKYLDNIKILGVITAHNLGP